MVWRPLCPRRYRPREGGAHRAAGCGLGCGPSGHNRGDDRREAEEGRRSSAARRRWHQLLISDRPAPSAGAGISEGRNDVWTDFERRCTSMRLCRQGDCSSKGIVKDPGAIASLTAFVARLYTRGMRDRDQPLTAAMQFVPMLPITPRELTPLLYAVQGDKGG